MREISTYGGRSFDDLTIYYTSETHQYDRIESRKKLSNNVKLLDSFFLDVFKLFNRFQWNSYA